MSSFSGIKNTLLASRWTKKLPPPMTQTQKNSKAPERYAPGPAVIFYGKKSCFSGVLRVHSICSDYDEAHRCLLSVNRCV